MNWILNAEKKDGLLTSLINIEVFKINIPMIEFNHWDIYFKSAYDFFIFILSFIFLLNSYNKEFRDEGAS